MNVIFLDFDGVINTSSGYDVDGSYRQDYNNPSDGKVNNYNAIKLLNKLCKEKKMAVVVDCKRWRNTYGHTPATDFNKDMEIKIYLEKHKEIEKFIILEDNPSEISRELQNFMVICNKDKGFTEREYSYAIRLLNNQPSINRGNPYIE